MQRTAPSAGEGRCHCALGAARRLPDLHRLALYEPPLPLDNNVVPDDALAEIEATRQSGDIATVLEVDLTQCVRIPHRRRAAEALCAALPETAIV